jgi:hypothetical protein
VVEDGVLLFVSIFGLIYLLIAHKATTLEVLAFGLILLLLTGLVAFLVLAEHQRRRLTELVTLVASRWARLRHRPYDPAPTQAAVKRVLDSWDRLGKGGWEGPLKGSAVNIVFDMLTLYLVFLASGHPVGPGTLLAGYGLPLLLGKAPLLPGGLGIIESSMAALYISLGVPGAVAVVVVLVYRLISFWLPSLLGFLLIPYLQRSLGGSGSKPMRRGNAQ